MNRARGKEAGEAASEGDGTKAIRGGAEREKTVWAAEGDGGADPEHGHEVGRKLEDVAMGQASQGVPELQGA